MKQFKKIIAITALLAMMATSARNLSAQNMCCETPEYYFGAGGYGYEEARRVPSLAPAIALGTVALVAVIALALNNGGHSHSGSSSSSSSSCHSHD